ncbi:hypothetical protein [Winogradskyella costae]|uniref:hypothetical protein n=1 Tax=Winogradskyella costae TaxID=2697008 RepID=UPI0015C87FC7|nr:hypothetical protein [Winogradskyella costae]
MKNKTITSLLPELFLICSIIYYWTLTSNLFNPIAIALLAIHMYQIFSKKMILGLLISTVVIILSLFMVLALVSELAKFSVVNQSYYNLLLFGSLYLGLTLLLAGLMFFKYLKLQMK